MRTKNFGAEGLGGGGTPSTGPAYQDFIVTDPTQSVFTCTTITPGVNYRVVRDNTELMSGESTLLGLNVTLSVPATTGTKIRIYA